MKPRLLRSHLSLLLLIAITSLTAQAQWTGSSSTSTTDLATRMGRVGIGVASPQNELHIKAISSGNADIVMETAAGYKWVVTGADGYYAVTNLGNTIQYMTVLTTGSVGIGATSPVSGLDVRAGNGKITCDAIYFYGNSAGTSGTDGLPNIRLEDAYGMRFRANNDGHYVFSSQTSVLVGYSPNGSTDYGIGNIVASGKIGIGTNAPTAFLDIADVTTAGIALVNVGNDAYLTDIDVSNILGIYGRSDNTQGGIQLGSSGALIYGLTGKVGIGTTNPANDLHIDPLAAGGITVGKNSDGAGGNTGYTALLMNISQYQNGYASIQSIAQSGATPTYGNLALNANGGNVGIGTGTVAPAATLEINGTFKVSGAAKFNNRVDANEYHACVSTGTCPDYVFAKEYQLKSLEEVEKYITANKHLPEVPSAKEMESNGMDMKEMNLLLLKKVEEITLYMLQQQKKMDMQQQKIEALETQMKNNKQ